MALNPQYMISPNLQEFFIDKTTGLPLTAGIVTYYSDTNRTELKNVYQLTGYPDYTYTELPNPLILSDVGTTVNESGEDVRVYYYPYDDNGNVELYYITVEASDNTPQLEREAWPNLIEDPTAEVMSDVFNYIPNGQFRTHYNVIEDPNDIGKIDRAVTNLAAGGWTFERPAGSTATDIVTFFRYGSYVTNPTASPRFAVNVACNGANPSDSHKYLAVKFKDVNKFAGTQDFTFTFSSTLGPSSSFDVNLYVIKYYGTGGAPSPSDVILKDTFTIGSGTLTHTSTFNFGDNVGKGIGTDNNDYVQIAIGFPTDQTFTARFTDFSLVFGNVVLTGYPIQTDSDTYSRSIFGNITETLPDGYDLNLPIVKTKDGTAIDYSQVGKIFASGNGGVKPGELYCDGAMYETAGYSELGIPYKRLFDRLLSPNLGMGVWGTGQDFVTALFNDSDSKILLTTNKAGAQTATANGAVSPGFTITTTSTGTTSLGFIAFTNTATKLWVECTSVGTPISLVGLTSTAPVTVNVLRHGSNVPSSPFGEEGYLSGLKTIYQVVVNGLPAAGQYFYISTHTILYHVWFTVNGSGSAPVASGTAIKVDILSTMTATTVTQAIQIALNAYQGSTVYTIAGNAITPNSYWNFYANGLHYYVWYSLNGTGTDPEIPSATGIKVNYTTADSAVTVGLNTLVAINEKYFAVPDLRGMFLRGWDAASGNDRDTILRYSMNAMVGPSHSVGTYQFDEILSHDHKINAGTNNNVQAIVAIGGNVPVIDQTLFTGGNESRPVNAAVVYVIKY